MSLKQPPKVITTERCAAQVIKTIPLVMRFMRTEMRSHSSSFLSVPQFRTLAFLYRYPSGPLCAIADHLGVTRAGRRQ